jgi:predicted amidohydrolase
MATPKNVRICVAVISRKAASIKDRVRDIQARVAAAAKAGVKLIIFPEYLAQHRTLEAMAHLKQCLIRRSEVFPGGEFTAIMRAAAQQHRIGILFGTIGRKSDGNYYNLMISLSSSGRILGHYAKTHLAPGEDSDEKITPGKSLSLVRTEIGRAGIITCYELYFPEIARTYQKLGAVFLCCPTADTSEMVLPTARARARETSTPMVLSGYSGPQAKNTHVGAIIDAHGTLLAAAEFKTKNLVADLPLEAPHGSPFWDRPKVRLNLRRWTYNRRRRELYRL